jgi:hypothetical protein
MDDLRKPGPLGLIQRGEGATRIIRLCRPHEV